MRLRSRRPGAREPRAGLSGFEGKHRLVGPPIASRGGEAAANHEGQTVHILTKIFVVLVSLLAVLLVPLVVVYAYNEDSYKAKYDVAVATANANAADLDAAKAIGAAQLAGKEIEIQELRGEKARLEGDVAGAERDLRDLQNRLVAAESMQAEINTKLTTLTSTAQAAQELNESLIMELRGIRSLASASERQKVELDEALRDLGGRLEVAIAARRALQEELQQLKGEHAKSLEHLSLYLQRYPELRVQPESPYLGGMGGIHPDRNLDTTVIGVRRENDQVLAEIDVGTRDGVKEGWTGTISQGEIFIANIRLIEVDINRSVGVVDLEAKSRGLVQIGHRVFFRAGDG